MNATTTPHQRSVQVMYKLERYKIMRQNNVDFLMIQGRFPFGLYKKKINTKTSMSSLLFDEPLINIGVEFNKLQKLMIFFTTLRFEYDIGIYLLDRLIYSNNTSNFKIKIKT